MELNIWTLTDTFLKEIYLDCFALPSCFSPVIKVGKATDATADEETVLSDSDDEFQQNQTFVHNKRVRSNLFWPKHLLLNEC